MGLPVESLRAVRNFIPGTDETAAQQAWIWSDGEAWARDSPQTKSVVPEWKDADWGLNYVTLSQFPPPPPQGRACDPRRETGSL